MTICCHAILEMALHFASVCELEISYNHVLQSTISKYQLHLPMCFVLPMIELLRSPYIYLFLQELFQIVSNSFMKEVQYPARRMKKEGQNPFD